jgi:hypothetical protein
MADAVGMARAVRMKGSVVKVVVIRGTGLIGLKLVDKLGEHGQETVPIAPNTHRMNTLTTGEGIAAVLEGGSGRGGTSPVDRGRPSSTTS